MIIKLTRLIKGKWILDRVNTDNLQHYWENPDTGKTAIKMVDGDFEVEDSPESIDKLIKGG